MTGNVTSLAIAMLIISTATLSQVAPAHCMTPMVCEWQHYTNKAGDYVKSEPFGPKATSAYFNDMCMKQPGCTHYFKAMIQPAGDNVGGLCDPSKPMTILERGLWTSIQWGSRWECHVCEVDSSAFAAAHPDGDININGNVKGNVADNAGSNGGWQQHFYQHYPQLMSIGGSVNGNVADHGGTNGDWKENEQVATNSNGVHFAQQQIKSCEGSGNGGVLGAAHVVCCKSRGEVCCAGAAFDAAAVKVKVEQCPESMPYVQQWADTRKDHADPPDHVSAGGLHAALICIAVVTFFGFGGFVCRRRRVQPQHGVCIQIEADLPVE